MDFAYANSRSVQDFDVETQNQNSPFQGLVQHSSIENDYLNIQAEHYYKSKNFQLEVKNRLDFNKNNLDLDSNLASGIENFKKFSNATDAEITFKYQKIKFKVSPGFYIGRLTNLEKNESLVTPLFNGEMSFSPMPKHRVSFVFLQRIQLPRLDQVVSIPWVAGFRTLNQNTGDLGFIKSNKISGDYEIEFNTSSFNAKLFSGNNLHQLNNDFTTTFKANKSWSALVKLKHFNPNIKNQFAIIFLNVEANYNWERANCELFICGRNLLNEKKFRNLAINDFSQSETVYDLQERTVLLGMRFKL